MVNLCFNQFYNVKSLTDDTLNPEHKLHTYFKEWCNALYPGAYNEIILDDEGMPVDLENSDLRLITQTMLLDLNIIELDRPYQHLQNLEQPPPVVGRPNPTHLIHPRAIGPARNIIRFFPAGEPAREEENVPANNGTYGYKSALAASNHFSEFK